ncbi:MAG: hypothetical protein WEB78_10915, partial [Ilumatobacteraceae bacterium]
AALFVLVAATAPFATFHQDLYLSGTPQRFAATVVRAGRSNARGALWLDNVFALSWLLIAPRCLRAGLERWAPERRCLVPIWRAAPTVALLAGCVDLLENVLALSQVGKRRPPTGFTLAVASLTWTKWMLYAVALAGVMALVVGPLMAPVLRPLLRRLFAPFDGDQHGDAGDAGDAGAEGVARAAQPGPLPHIGLAVAAGQVPAGSKVALGVLRRLDEARDDGQSVFRRADMLVAAAGAAPVAGGWRVQAGADVGLRDGSFDAGQPWVDHVERSLDDLAERPLGRFGGGRVVASRCLVAAVTFAAAAYVIGAALGSAIRTRAIHSWFPYTDRTAGTIIGLRELLPLRLVLPGVALLVVAVLLRFAARRQRHLAPYASGATVGGVLLVVLLLVAPITIRYARRVIVGVPFVHRADSGALALAAIAIVLLAVGVWLLVAPHPSFVGGRLLIAMAGTVLVVLTSGKVADTFARGIDGAWVSWPLPGVDARLPVAVPALLWLGVIAIVPPHRLWLFDRTRRAMTAVFLPGGDRAWSTLGAVPGPSLAIVGAVGTTASVVITGRGVTTYAGLADTGTRVASRSLPTGSWWDGFPARWTVGRSIALIGLSTGEWIPNPSAAPWFADPITSPRVHPGLVIGRLLGRHRRDRDSFIHASGGDGTGVLALVELLRHRPDVALSTGVGDARTFLSAVEPLLAELGIVVTQLDPMLNPMPSPMLDAQLDLMPDVMLDALLAPMTDVVSAQVRYPDGSTALVVHGGVMIDAETEGDLVAAGYALAGRMVGLFERCNP